MGYFEELLSKRNLSECPLPLWRLKITDEEYESLRLLLREETRFFSYYETPFRKLRKEACLFFAEYWRREFKPGSHSKRMVYEALEPIGYREQQIEGLYSSACKGAKLLKIEQYNGGRIDPLNDMLYQGGLPMRLLTEGGQNSVWDRFVRGLVHRHIDFDELQLGRVASQSGSMREYCDQLIKGIESEQYMLMPFYCDNESNRWFMALKELARRERIRQRHLHAFLLSWEFAIDDLGKTIQTKFDLRGQMRLPQAFLEEYQLEESNFFSAQVRVNGKAVDTFDYANNFCRYAVVSKHPYRDGDRIALFLADRYEPIITEELDMSVPHLLGITKDELYELTGQLGKRECCILIPEGWEEERDYGFEIDTYHWNGMKLRCMIVPSTYDSSIKLRNQDGSIEFSQNASLYWTEIQTHPLYQPDVMESVYDASQCQFKLCYDSAEGEKSYRCTEIEYRSKRQSEWSSEAAYGEIFARAKNGSGHQFVTPVRFINVGDGLTVSLQSADEESCRIKVAWSNGHVSTEEGTKKSDDVWEIRRENCNDARHIHFLFTPTGFSQNQFTLSIRAPFKEFAIDDIYGKHINNEAWIPYTEVDKYQYHLVGQNIKSYTYGNVERSLKWYGDKLYIVERGERKNSIPYEGSLLTLFDNRETLRSLLDRTSKNMIDAEVEVVFTFYSGETLTFSIKDSPFRVKQFDDGHVMVTEKNGRLVNFKGVLKLTKLDEPTSPSIEMSYDEENGYVLPEEIRDWGKTLLYGRTRGRICPSLVDLSRQMNTQERRATRADAIASISESITHATMKDDIWQRITGWFHRTQKDDIPASSLLELVCAAQTAGSLMNLSFLLFSECSDEDEKEDLKGQLISMSNDLAFQWYWLLPMVGNTINALQPFIDSLDDNKVFITMYIRWALKQQDNAPLLSAIGKEEFFDYAMQFLNSIVEEYITWMKELCVSSMLQTYGGKPDRATMTLADVIVCHPKEMLREEVDHKVYVEHSQDYIDSASAEFFNRYAISYLSDNESWLMKRVGAVAAHLNGKTDLFLEDEKIRRSIIYCNKANTYRFIVELNNKLLTSK